MSWGSSIVKGLKASTKSTKTVSKTGAVVGGVTAAAAGAAAGAGITALTTNTILPTVNNLNEWAKYIPYIIAGICGIIILSMLFKKKGGRK